MADAGLIDFVAQLTRVRREHPSLRAAEWLKGAPTGTGLLDVEWRDAEGPLEGARWDAGDDVLAAVFSHADDRVLVVFNRGGVPVSLRLPEAREGYRWRLRVDTSEPARADRDVALADRLEAPARSTLAIAEAKAPNRLRAPDSQAVDALAAAAGIAPEWWDVSGKRTRVTAETKLTLLKALRLPARTRDDARDSLNRLVTETTARRVPVSVTLRQDEALNLPLRSAPGEAPPSVPYRVVTETGEAKEGRLETRAGQRRWLADGREVDEALLTLPQLPLGRHELQIDGASCWLTIAPAEAFGSRATRRRRFGAAAQLYALRRREGDQGIGDLTALGLAGEAVGRAGADFLGVSPMHALFSSDRGRASPYHPSDRRFLEPFLIDCLADGALPSDENWRKAVVAEGDAIRRAASLASVDYDAVWRLKRNLLRARFAAFQRARKAQPAEPIFAEHAAFIAERGEQLQRFALFEAVTAERGGEEWRRWPEALRDAQPGALDAKSRELAEDYDFAIFCQWLADRQLAAAAAKAKAAGLEIGLYRDLAVGAAPDGAESWSRAHELGVGVSVGAPPDPFSEHGQNWHLPAPDPLAGARDGWRGFAGLYRANMRHAGMLRIDHAMGLTRLFLIPDGASAAEGAYIAYPVDDLIGQIALESQREQCMIIGEDLGTVPEGFRERLTSAHIAGMRVLWFERDGLNFLPPAEYPPLSVACVSTHDLATLAGWWQGADIAERLGLGLTNLSQAQRAIEDRLKEKAAIVAQLARAGLLPEPPDLDAPLSDALAAAVHAFLADSGSVLASAQFDDLAGETRATNLPGTDRERPNWRHRLGSDVEALLEGPRARAILSALAAKRS